jgi:hypothetical protein
MGGVQARVARVLQTRRSPREEFVDFLAIRSWRRRRPIRHEVALMDARHQSIKEAAASDPSIEILRSVEMKL